MAETATRAGFTRAAVEEIAGLESEPEWMRARRPEAFDPDEKMPLPARRLLERRHLHLRAQERRGGAACAKRALRRCARPGHLWPHAHRGGGERAPDVRGGVLLAADRPARL